jgi:hypothetical protein
LQTPWDPDAISYTTLEVECTVRASRRCVRYEALDDLRRGGSRVFLKYNMVEEAVNIIRGQGPGKSRNSIQGLLLLPPSS